MVYPYIPLQKPSALAGHKNGQLPANMLASIKTGGQMYTPVAAEFNKMYDAALAAGHKLRDVGDYRSFESQVRLFLDRYSTTDLGRVPQVRRTYEGKYWYLKPGKAPAATPDPEGVKGSNHGWGLAVDLAYEENGQLRGMGGACFAWLCENAPKYGFYLQTGDRNSKYWEAWHWQYCLGDAKPDPNNQPKVENLPAAQQGNQSLRKGAKGEAVKEIQRIVGAKPIDGDWGSVTDKAVKAWQKAHNLLADGIWGIVSDTHSKNCTCKASVATSKPTPQPAPPPALLKIGAKGDEVKAVQRIVGASPVDGDWGSVTDKAVKAWQTAHGLAADGVWGAVSANHATKCDCKPASTTPQYPGQMIRRGAKGEIVKLIQARVGVAVDGDFGIKTWGAVRRFQRANRACGVADGAVGPKTWKVMFG